jgi:hypothetical protein
MALLGAAFVIFVVAARMFYVAIQREANEASTQARGRPKGLRYTVVRVSGV